MGWLGPSGVSALTGARWGAGAVWAASASPAGPDSDWEDPLDWPRSLPGTAQRVPLAVYIDGVDFSEYVTKASWSFGSESLLPTGISTSSASVTLDENAPTVAVGARVIILTEWDVLWHGRVESPAELETPGAPTSVTLSLVDDLARGSIRDITVPLKGRPLTYTWGWGPAMVEYLLERAGVPVTWTDEVVSDRAAQYSQETHTGSAISILGSCLRYAGMVGSYRADGLLVRSPGLYVESTADVIVDDCQDAASSWTTQTRISDVITEYGTGYSESTVRTRYRNLEEYGRRRFETLDLGEWPPASINNRSTQRVLNAGELATPPTRISASYAIQDSDDTAHRCWPYDRMQQDAQDYVALRVAHDVSVDAWAVTISGVEVTATASWTTSYPS